MAGAAAGPMKKPLIVTALFAARDHAWLEQLRREHYPAARNRVPVHLTLFLHLAPSIGEELDGRLRAECRASSVPAARITGVVRLEQGVALRVASAGLEEIRARIAETFAPMLLPQDAGTWDPHITIQNKVIPSAAAALHQRLTRELSPRPLGIAGLGLWRYMDGPWEPLASHRFSRSGQSRRS